MTFYEVTTDAIPEVPRGTVICSICENGADPNFHMCNFKRSDSELNPIGRAFRRWCTENGYLKQEPPESEQ